MSLIGQKPEVYCTGITHITGYHEYYDGKKKKWMLREDKASSLH